MDQFSPKSVSHFIFEHLKNKQHESFASNIPKAGDVCAYCGHPFYQMVSMSRLELGRYMDWSHHKQRESKCFCLPCVAVLRCDDFRRKAVIASSNGIQFLRSSDAQDRSVLIQSIFYIPPEPPFIISIPTDFRKHLLLRANLNYSRSEFQVQFGEHWAAVAPALHQTLYQAVEQLFKGGITSTQILQRTYRIEQFLPLERIIAPWRPSALLLLVIELAKPVKAKE